MLYEHLASRFPCRARLRTMNNSHIISSASAYFLLLAVAHDREPIQFLCLTALWCHLPRLYETSEKDCAIHHELNYLYKLQRYEPSHALTCEPRGRAALPVIELPLHFLSTGTIATRNRFSSGFFPLHEPSVTNLLQCTPKSVGKS